VPGGAGVPVVGVPVAEVERQVGDDDGDDDDGDHGPPRRGRGSRGVMTCGRGRGASIAQGSETAWEARRITGAWLVVA